MHAERPPAYLIGVDGRSGAGKTDLAGLLAAALSRDGDPVPVVHLDELVTGWTGLSNGITRLVDEVLTPLSSGRPGLLRRWDWVRGVDGPVAALPWAPVVVVEGVGAGAAACRPFLSCLLWLDLDADERYRRAMERDGEAFRPWWDLWTAQEGAYLATDDPRAHADVVVGT